MIECCETCIHYWRVRWCVYPKDAYVMVKGMVGGKHAYADISEYNILKNPEDTCNHWENVYEMEG